MAGLTILVTHIILFLLEYYGILASITLLEAFMSFDLKLSRDSQRISRAIALSSEPISEEGVLLCGVIENGVEKAALVAAPAGNEKVIGFAYLADALPGVTSAFESLIVPAASSSLEVNLRNVNLVPGMLRLVVGGVALILETDYANVPAAGHAKVDYALGKVKFAAAQAGASVSAVYRYQLTVQQAIALFGQRAINNNLLHALHGQLEIGSGWVELYTDMFDANVDFSAGPLQLGAMGRITVGGAGPVLNARVISLPSANNPRLGVNIRFDP
jgi:hypothetical protein